MRIPITMCHGISEKLGIERLERYFAIASELGFESVSFEDLAKWRENKADLPGHPIMFDFDHPVKSIRYEVYEIMSRFGFKGNLFIHTQPLEEMYSHPLPDFSERMFLTWDEIYELKETGWNIGSHTHTHPDLSRLYIDDPTGERFRVEELEKNDGIIKRELGHVTRDFAFVGISWSSIAEKEVMKRYRFGRLWIVGTKYLTDGKEIRYADLVGARGCDEEDGGPPVESRYIHKDTDSYKIPSMELEYLIYEYDAFRKYLEYARYG